MRAVAAICSVVLLGAIALGGCVSNGDGGADTSPVCGVDRAVFEEHVSSTDVKVDGELDAANSGECSAVSEDDSVFVQADLHQADAAARAWERKSKRKDFRERCSEVRTVSDWSTVCLTDDTTYLSVLPESLSISMTIETDRKVTTEDAVALAEHLEEKFA